MTVEEPVLLRPAEAAALLGVSRSKLYQLIVANEIPSVRLTGSVRVPRRALLEWIEQQTVVPGLAAAR
jgi:excisionase family DNA binding protein